MRCSDAYEGSIPNVLQRIAPVLPKVAQGSGVAAIVAGVAYTGPGVEKVDVTMRIVEALEVDEQTRKLARELLENPPPPVEAAPHSH
jgi:hypothetical protein